MIRTFARPPAGVVAACIADIAAAITAANNNNNNNNKSATPSSVTTSAALLDKRSGDLSGYRGPRAPDAVVAVSSEDEIAAVLAICNKHKVPVIPMAGATSIEAQIVPTDAGGIILDVSGMDSIVAIHKDDMDAVVQPGINWIHLREVLEADGLLFPPDPGAAACIGGMCGTNCSGTLAFRYGTMKDNVLSLRVALADGTVIQTRRRAVKSSAGYDLTRLFIGSEGTLGVITQATLRLRRIPTHRTVALAQFATLRAATTAVHRLVLTGTPFQRVELIDAHFLRALALQEASSAAGFPFDLSPTLLVECVVVSDSGVAEQVAAFHGVCGGAQKVRVAESAEEADRLFALRKKVYFAGPLLRAHESVPAAVRVDEARLTRLSTDVAVPVSRLGDAMEATERMLQEEGLIGPMVAHAGDGNFHCMLLVKIGDAEEAAASERIKHRLGELALSMDGTVSGEHGIGMSKRALFQKEADPAALVLMKKIKKTLDPNNILNPGKIFVPDDDSHRSHL
ncbi:hypothetical protein DFJ73DRAFT_632388 [Zopfochytrium polystomum]|nr:hypothetical protein DFJ73DRAFT_632388 [Zopfochytrium polystomum]